MSLSAALDAGEASGYPAGNAAVTESPVTGGEMYEAKGKWNDAYGASPRILSLWHYSSPSWPADDGSAMPHDYGNGAGYTKLEAYTSGIRNISLESGLGAARANNGNDVYPTAAIEINGLTPNGPVLADNDFFGTSVASTGDLDGDGVPDLAVSARDNADADGKNIVYVMLMNADGTVKSTSEINGTTPNGPVLADYDNFGTSIASVGDLDGDGVPDLAVGAERDDAGGVDRGAVHVMLMNADGTVKSTSRIDDRTPNGPVLADYDFFGTSMASVGDLDGDGVRDWAVGARLDGLGGPSMGAVHVMLMNADGTVKSTSEINGTTPNGPVLAGNDYFGKAVASMGDLDGDGVPDLAVGAYWDDADGYNRGAVHVMLMNADGTVKSTSEINARTPNGPVLADHDHFGAAVASMGDLDGDGVFDLAVGAYGSDASGYGRGAVHVILMNADGTVKSTSEINDLAPNGPVLQDNDNFGTSVASMGDLDGDGVRDLVAGIYAGSDAGGFNRGGVHVVTLGLADRASPALTDAVLDARTRILTLTFNEAMDVTPPDNVRLDSVFIAGGSGETSRTALTGAALSSTSDGSTLTVTLTAAQLRHAIALAAPHLDIEAGAVRDMSANPIAASAGNPITVLHVNRAPVADAGANQSASERTTVTLDGSGSTDPDDDAITYRWSSVPSLAFSDAAAQSPTFTAPEVTSDTDYAITLNVSDGTLSDTDTVTVTVREVNRAPVADAGANQSASERTTVTLDGSGSTDPDDDAITYRWSSVPSLAFSDAAAQSPTFTAPEVTSDTDYAITLNVSDGTLSDTDTVTVMILDSAPPVTPPPAVPANLTATSTADSVTLAWDDPGDDTITGYKILSRMPATQPTLGVLVNDTGSADNTYTARDLEPGVLCEFGVVALSDHGESGTSKTVLISTASPPPPSAPTGLIATSITADSVTLAWDDPGDDTITGYKILSRMPATQPTLGVLVNDTGSAGGTYTVDNLEPGTKYAFRIIALSDHGESKISKFVSIHTKKPPPPSAPTGLIATSITADSVTLAWDDPGDDTITGYKILSRMPATQPTLGVLVNDTGSAGGTYTVDNLEPGTKYAFRIIALSDHGESKISKFVSIHTKKPSPSHP